MTLHPSTLRTTIVGNQFRPISSQIRYSELVEGEELRLEAEPTNEYDPQAIKVLTQNGLDHLGYIPRGRTSDVRAGGDLEKAFAVWTRNALEISWPDEGTASDGPTD